MSTEAISGAIDAHQAHAHVADDDGQWNLGVEARQELKAIRLAMLDLWRNPVVMNALDGDAHRDTCLLVIRIAKEAQKEPALAKAP